MEVEHVAEVPFTAILLILTRLLCANVARHDGLFNPTNYEVPGLGLGSFSPDL